MCCASCSSRYGPRRARLFCCAPPSFPRVHAWLLQGSKGTSLKADELIDLLKVGAEGLKMQGRQLVGDVRQLVGAAHKGRHGAFTLRRAARPSPV